MWRCDYEGCEWSADADCVCPDCGGFYCRLHGPRYWPSSRDQGRWLCQKCNLRAPSQPRPEISSVQSVVQNCFYHDLDVADKIVSKTSNSGAKPSPRPAEPGPAYPLGAKPASPRRLESGDTLEAEDGGAAQLDPMEFYLTRRRRMLAQKAIAGRMNSKGMRGDTYFHMRDSVLEQKSMNKRLAAIDVESGSLKPRAGLLEESDDDDDPNAMEGHDRPRVPSDNTSPGGRPMSRSDGDALRPGAGGEDGQFSFSGMHHVFDDEEKLPVSVVKFANDSKSLLAWGSLSGKVQIAELLPRARIEATLTGHTKGVTDIGWSYSNTYLISSSFDMSARVWSPTEGTCLRILYDDDAAPILGNLFHPSNNNLFVLGNANAVIKFFNVSTGMCLQKARVPGSVRCMTFDKHGDTLFVGDAIGRIHTFLVKKGHYQPYLVTKVCKDKSITCVSYSSGVQGTSGPVLLINCCDNALRILSVANLTRKKVEQLRAFPIAQAGLAIRSSFCMTIGGGTSSCVVTGGEDCTVRFFDIVRDSKPQVNTLIGHTAEVIDIAWNCDGAFLASSDSLGNVIVWQRAGMPSVKTSRRKAGQRRATRV